MVNIDQYRSSTEFELLGIWFLENQDIDDGLKGTLYFNKDNIRLELYDSFENPLQQQYSKKYIYGFTKDGKTAILHNAVSIDSKNDLPGFPTTTYKIEDFLLFEINYAHTDWSVKSFLNEINIDGYKKFEVGTISFSFDYIYEWLQKTSMVKKKDINNNIITIESDLGNYEKNEYKIPSKNIAFSNHLKINTEPKYNGILMKEEHLWDIKSLKDEKITFDDLLTESFSFKKLIQFFSNSSLKFDYIEFLYESSNIHKEENSGDRFIKGRYFFKEIGEKSVRPSNVTMPYTRIEKEFEAILNNWFLMEDDLQFIIDSYLSDLHLPYYVETQLLNTLRILEVYHRNFMDNQRNKSVDEKLEAEKDQLISYIDKTISEENKNRFIRNVKYDPETTLNKRLKELFKEIPEELAQNTIKYSGKSLSRSRNDLSYKLTETRNYYTHGDKQEKYPNRIKGMLEKYETNRKLRIIVMYFIYKELGVSTENILKALIPETRKSVIG